MTPKDEQLLLLRRMRSEGRLTRDEFEELSGGRGKGVESTSATDSADTRDEVVEAVDPIDAEVPTPFDESDAEWPRLRNDLSANYFLGVGAISLILVVLSVTDSVPWSITVVTLGVITSTLFAGLGKVTAVGALLLAGIVVISAASSLDGSKQADPALPSTLTVTTLEGAPTGSLGLYMDDVIVLWNTVEGDPQIRNGLTRQNEIGEFDTLIHRFGDGSQLAGAYGPEDEAVYALLASGPFPSTATAQLYLRLCFMTAPYSQDCIDAYNDQGLAGLTLEDYVDSTHESEWRLDEHTWRLEIGQNVLALRVYGPDAN